MKQARRRSMPTTAACLESNVASAAARARAVTASSRSPRRKRVAKKQQLGGEVVGGSGGCGVNHRDDALRRSQHVHADERVEVEGAHNVDELEIERNSDERELSSIRLEHDHAQRR